MKDSKLLLVLVVSLIVVGILILSNFLSFANLEGIVTDLLIQNQATETEHAAGRMETHILQVRDGLVTLSKFPEARDISVDNCKVEGGTFHEEVTTVVDSLLLADVDGDVIGCSSPKSAAFLGLNIINKDYFQVPKDRMEPFVTGTVGQGASSQIIVSVPLLEDTAYSPYSDSRGDFKGVLFTVIEIEDLYNRYLHPYIQPGRNEFIIFNPETEETLIRSQGIEEYATFKENIPISSRVGTVMDFGEFGETIVTSTDMILGSTRLQLMVMTPLDVAGPNMRSLQNRHLFGMFFILIVGLIAVVFFIVVYRQKEEYQSKLKKANVTLERLGINIDVEKGVYTDSDISLDPGKIYLVKEEDENHSHELFISTLNQGYAGLGIVREDPTTLKKRYNLSKTSFIWLTRTGSGEIPTETDISVLMKLISEFLEKSTKGVILLDRIDYIISENDFEVVIKAVHSLADTIRGKDCVVIIALNPDLATKYQLSKLEAETVDIYGKQLEKRVSLTGEEAEILAYVNKNNVENKLVSYKDITSTFKITKPTTRTRINKLSSLGLLAVEQNGRYKSLKITSSGRRLLR